jgi:hypothetical protein
MEKDGDNGGKPMHKGVHLESVILTPEPPPKQTTQQPKVHVPKPVAIRQAAATTKGQWRREEQLAKRHRKGPRWPW